MSDTAAVILAAGSSSRLGQPKQLLQWQGETLLARAVRLAREAGADPVIVVLGCEAELISRSIPPNRAFVVTNTEWATGMASSIRVGVEAADKFSPEAVLLMVCDQPRLDAEHLRRLIAARQGMAAAASRYAGRLAVPACFERDLFPALKQLQGNAGAKELLQLSRYPVAAVEFASGEFDVDWPADIR